MRTFIFAALLFVSVAVGTWYVMDRQAQDAAQQQPAAGGPGGGLPVTAMTVESNSIDIFEELPGRTAAYKIAEIRPQVGGIITERLFEEGSLVKEGQQLYQIDATPYKAAHNSALATLKKAQANVKATQAKAVRYAELVIIEAVSKQEYDDVVAALDQAQADVAIGNAAVASAKVNLDYTKVYAPISGRIGKSTITQGALVTANQAEPLATITQLDPIYVDVNQSSADVMRLRQNAALESVAEKSPVSVTVDGSGQAYPHTGTLEFSEVTVEETTGMVKLRATVPNPDQVLLPGLFVKAKIKQGSEDNAILVPQRAANRSADGTLTVWVIGADGTVNPRPIETKREIGDQWLVSGGLQAGEKIALDSFQKMQPGMPVTPVDPAAAPAQGANGAAAPHGGDMPAPPTPMESEGAAPAEQTPVMDAPATPEQPQPDATPAE